MRRAESTASASFKKPASSFFRTADRPEPDSLMFGGRDFANSTLTVCGYLSAIAASASIPEAQPRACSETTAANPPRLNCSAKATASVTITSSQCGKDWRSRSPASAASAASESTSNSLQDRLDTYSPAFPDNEQNQRIILASLTRMLKKPFHGLFQHPVKGNVCCPGKRTETETPRQCGAFSSDSRCMVPRDRIELPTRGFSVLCSTD